jgi:hypothetical protein
MSGRAAFIIEWLAAALRDTMAILKYGEIPIYAIICTDDEG